MKNKCYLLYILLTIIFFSLPSMGFSAQPNPKIWKTLEYNSYYNIKIITTSSDTILVWTYKTVTDDTRKKRIEEVKKYDLERSTKYQQYHHEAVLWEIDCKKKLCKLKDIIDFDNNEKVLDRYRYNDTEWESILPNSRVELLYRRTCIIPTNPIIPKKPLKKK
jgi:hypothetical protein